MNFKIKKTNLLIYFILIAINLSQISCISKSDSVKAEEDHHDEKSSDMIEISPKQFEAAKIGFGSFEMKNLSDVITANGYTKLPPQNQADVSVFVNGIIKSISVIEGQAVYAGQTIATFLSLDYNNMRMEKSRLMQDLQSSINNKDYLSMEYARQKTLSEEDINAKKTFQKVTAELSAEMKKIEALESQLKIVNENLQLGGNSDSALLKIKAPISGFISSINVKIGSSINPSLNLFSIVDNSKMHVDLLVYEKDLFKLKEGMDVRFVLTNQGNQEIMGKIFSIGKSFLNESKAVPVHTTINSKNTKLISGMYVNALINIGSSNVSTLPLDAIVKADGKDYIFIGQDDSAEKHDHAHETGEKEEAHTDDGRHFKRIEISSGVSQFGFVQVNPMIDLPKDAKIVIKGAYYLQSTMITAVSGGDHNH